MSVDASPGRPPPRSLRYATIGGFADLLEGLVEQIQLPKEIVVVDGGSEDGTRDELEGRQDDPPPVQVFVAPGAKSTIAEAKMQKLASRGGDSKPARGRNAQTG